MYPSIVILFVNTQRSIVDIYGFSTVFKSSRRPTRDGSSDPESRPATMGHLSFALTQMGSMMSGTDGSDTIGVESKHGIRTARKEDVDDGLQKGVILVV